MVFLTLKTRFPREREFLAYVKQHTDPADKLEARSIQIYMRVCRIFWLDLTAEQKRQFAQYYVDVSLNRLETFGPGRTQRQVVSRSGRHHFASVPGRRQAFGNVFQPDGA